MPNIIGIKVRAATAGGWWSDTNDAVYVGVYGTQGGREFRIDVENFSEFATPNSLQTFSLGQICCRDGSELSVLLSTGKSINDPAAIPLDMDSVQFVYLRKEEHHTALSDDWLILDLAEVLLCDDSGSLRRFRQNRQMHFWYESGLQHWLPEVEPPKCIVTVTLDSIEHKDQAKKPAGFDWYFNFGASINGQWKPLATEYHYKPNKKRNPDEWRQPIGSAQSWEIVGCCPQNIDISLRGDAREADWPSKDDFGSGSSAMQVNCTHDGSRTTGQIAFQVEGENKNKKSQITFNYSVTAVCSP